MKFEYDEAKNKANIAKHGVSFEEAALAFTDKNRKNYPRLFLQKEMTIFA